MSDLEEDFLFHIKAIGLSEPEREYRFHPKRRWRFDFAWPDLKIAVEIEGGVWTGGRHVRGAGFVKDCEKYNAAVEEGWRVLRFPGSMVSSGEAINQLERIMIDETLHGM